MRREQHVLGHLHLTEVLEQLLDDVQEDGVIVADAAWKSGARSVGLARALLQPLQVRLRLGQCLCYLCAALGGGGRAGELGLSPEGNVA
jgi:hypothetical protein